MNFTDTEHIKAARKAHVCDWCGERERIAIEFLDDRWVAAPFADPSAGQSGPTPLIAAMRALVAAKLGPQVELPEAQEAA